MPTFRNFANRGFDKNLPAKPISIRHPNPHDNGIGPRMEKLLADDFGKCRSRADYEQYISKYGKYTSNKYISLAQEKIKAIDEEEKKQRAEAARRKKRVPFLLIQNQIISFG